MLAYPAVFDPAEEGGYVVTFPDFVYGGTQGDTYVEAMRMAEDLLTTLLGVRMKDRETIPKPGKVRGKHVRAVRVPALIAAKVQLYSATAGCAQIGTRAPHGAAEAASRKAPESAPCIATGST